jgi:hypothetical protein
MSSHPGSKSRKSFHSSKIASPKNIDPNFLSSHFEERYMTPKSKFRDMSPRTIMPGENLIKKNLDLDESLYDEIDQEA